MPRSTSVSDSHCVVTPDDSMKSRNGGLIRPSSSSATAHHRIASSVQPNHHAVKRHHRRLGRCAAHQMIAARQPVSVATAFTAPISATATAERAASCRIRGSPRSARITGSSTHGASIMGSVSEEMAPSVVSARGDRANATAASTREDRLPMPRASATLMTPQNPTTSSNAHHSRCVTQPGRPMTSPARKNVPCGNR
ncbi:Uncharacterised protein [Mycobacteroides abscessus subsp. abscessus]|nr:Uncharacterised protein [Mycobacteroides abscessus subsp. abscessus]